MKNVVTWETIEHHMTAHYLKFLCQHLITVVLIFLLLCVSALDFSFAYIDMLKKQPNKQTKITYFFLSREEKGQLEEKSLTFSSQVGQTTEFLRILISFLNSAAELML